MVYSKMFKLALFYAEKSEIMIVLEQYVRFRNLKGTVIFNKKDTCEKVWVSLLKSIQILSFPEDSNKADEGGLLKELELIHSSCLNLYKTSLIKRSSLIDGHIHALK